MQKDTADTAFKRGRNDFYADREIGDCPYEYGTPQGLEWQCGFNTAKSSSEKSVDDLYKRFIKKEASYK